MSSADCIALTQLSDYYYPTDTDDIDDGGYGTCPVCLDPIDYCLGSHAEGEYPDDLQLI